MIEFGVNNNIQHLPFLIQSIEERDNNVKYIIALPNIGNKGEIELESEFTNNPALVKILSECSSIYPDENNLYEIFFKDYILHMTSNESYSFGNTYDVGNGDYFIIFEKSKLLDHLPDLVETGIIKAIYKNGYKHYGICCQNHTIDVITAYEPIIRKYSG